MQRFISAIANGLTGRPLTCAAILLALLVSFGLGVPRLELDASSNGLIVPNDPAAKKYEDIKATFGDDVAYTVIYRADPLFTPDILKSIDDFTFALEDMDGVTRVISLATVANLRGEGDVLNTDQLMPYPPENQAAADEIGVHALANEILIGEVVGRDGHATAITAFIEARQDDRTLERRLLAKIKAVIAKEQAKLGGDVVIYVSGSPVLKTAIVESLIADATLLAPLSLVALGIVLMLFFRAGIVIILPVVTGVISVVTTLGFMGWIGFAVNPLTVIIPSMLLVIGSTEDIHLISEYASSLGKSGDKPKAISAMLRLSGLAIVVTSLTTTFGFLTLAPNDIPMIAEFGLAAAFGMTINFVITVLAAPLVARLTPAPKHFYRPEPPLLSGLKRGIIYLVLKRRKLVIVLSFLFFAVSGGLASQVIVDTDFLAFFNKDAEVRVRLEEQAKDISGSSILMVEVNAHRSGALNEPETLAEIARLTDYLAERYDDALSFDVFIRKMHMEVNGGDPAYYVVPEDRDLISQYTLLLAPDTLARFADFEMSRGLILVRTRLGGSHGLMRELPVLKAFAEATLPPSLTVTISGESVLIARSSDAMSREVAINLLYVFAAIFVLLSLLFNSFRAGLLSLAPNLLPIVGVFGAMYLLGIPFGTTIFPVAVIALGIAVDDTIHFMTRYAQELRTHDTNEAAILATVEIETRPVVASSTALIAGFLVLMFGEFGSIQQFGILSAVAMLLAVVADLCVTPVLLVTTPIITTWDLLKVRLDPGFETESAMLRGLKPGEIRRVAASAIVRTFEPGEHLLTEGDIGRDMFLILSGHVDVRTGPDQRLLGEAGMGNVVGELAFLTGAKRSAHVIARDTVETIIISSAVLERIQRRSPRIAAKLFKNIAVILTARLTQAQAGESEETGAR